MQIMDEFGEDAYIDEQNMLASLRRSIQGIGTKVAKGKDFVYICNAQALEELLRKFFPVTLIRRISLCISMAAAG